MKTGLRTVREMPLLAVVIILILGLLAKFADVFAPHNPELPVENVDPAFFAPPMWAEGGRTLRDRVRNLLVQSGFPHRKPG